MTGQLNTAMCLEGLNRRGGGGEGDLSEPVGRSGSGSTLDKTEEIVNDILFVYSNID